MVREEGNARHLRTADRQWQNFLDPASSTAYSHLAEENYFETASIMAEENYGKMTWGVRKPFKKLIAAPLSKRTIGA